MRYPAAVVMRGLGPRIHAVLTWHSDCGKAGMAGTSPARTVRDNPSSQNQPFSVKL